MRTFPHDRRLSALLVMLLLVAASPVRASSSDENVQRALEGFGQALGNMLAQQQAINQAIAQGDAALQQGNYAAARAAYRQALQLNPRLAIGVARLAYVAWLEGDLRSAASQYEQAVQLAPRDASIHDALGQVYYQQGQFLAAIPRHQRAAELNRKVAAYQGNLGMSLAQSGQPDAAAAAFEAALKIDPRYHLAHLWLAHLAKLRGDFDSAIAQIVTARRLAPNDPNVHDALGSAYFEQGKVEESIPHYEQAVKLAPLAPQFHNNLGAALVRLGKNQEALAPLREAVRLSPNYALAHGWLAMALRALGQEAEAFAAAEQYVKLQPNLPASDTIKTLHAELKAKIAAAAPPPKPPEEKRPGAGTPAVADAKPAAGGTNFGGTWETDFGALTLTQTGSRVKGTFTNPAGALDGVATGNILRFTWQQTASRKSGSGRFTLASDATSFLGRWNSSDDPDAAAEGTWHGNRTGGAASGTAVGSTTAGDSTTGMLPRVTPPQPAIYGRPEAVTAAIDRAGTATSSGRAIAQVTIAGGRVGVPQGDFWQVGMQDESALTMVAAQIADCSVAFEWEQGATGVSADQRQTWLAQRHPGVERLRDLPAGGGKAWCFAWAEGEAELRREYFHADCRLPGDITVRLTAGAPASVWQQHADSILALLQLEVRGAPPTAETASTPGAGATDTAAAPGAAAAEPLEVCNVITQGAAAARAYRLQKVPIADGALVVQHDAFWQVAENGPTYAFLGAPNSPDLSVVIDWQPAAGAAATSLEDSARTRRQRLKTQYARVEELANRTIAGSAAAQTAWLTSAEGTPQEVLELECLARGLVVRATISAPPAVWKKDGRQVLRLLEDIAAGG